MSRFILPIEIFFGLLLVACNNSISTPANQINATSVTADVFEGFYVSDINVSSFIPCDKNELPSAGKGHWLVPNAKFTQMLNNPSGITTGDIIATFGPYDVFALYVQFEGIVSAEPGMKYGYLGGYNGEIVITKAMRVERRWVGSRTHPVSLENCRYKSK